MQMKEMNQNPKLQGPKAQLRGPKTAEIIGKDSRGGTEEKQPPTAKIIVLKMTWNSHCPKSLPPPLPPLIPIKIDCLPYYTCFVFD